MTTENMKLSRRGFLGLGAAATAAAAAAGLAGCAPKTMAETGPAEPEGYTWETAPEPITEVDATEETDVVVIGGGIAGFSAACSAAEKGAKVVLLEKTGAGQFRGIDYGAIGGKLQLEAGIDLRDRKQDVLQEVLRWGDHRGDYRVVKAWVDHSAEALDWAADMLTNHGITIAPIPMEMQVIPDAWYEHYATDAFQIVPTDELIAEGGEAGYEPPFAIGWAKAFTAYAGELGVDVRFNTEALQLVQDEAGAVAGVVCEDKAGVTRIDAKAVVMATGGYGNDEEMMDAFIPGHAEDVHSATRRLRQRRGDDGRLHPRPRRGRPQQLDAAPQPRRRHSHGRLGGRRHRRGAPLPHVLRRGRGRPGAHALHPADASAVAVPE